MKIKVSRRDFFRTGAFAGLGARLFGGLAPVTFAQSRGSRPLVISSANGLRATAKAMEMIREGKDTLDAVVAGVAIVEDDPKDMSVGYGGLPNEDGVVELDASVMHGPTKRAGAVASIQRIKNAAQVAKLVMERTDHVLLVGPGALRFALAHGFKDQELLTDEARIVWLRWKERMSGDDGWGPGLAAPPDPKQSRLYDGTPIRAELLALADDYIAHPPTGTINCIAVNERGDISGTTTTSGLFHKLAGRVGDSPLIGCGLFVDNEVGAAGSTGRGEECIKINGAHTVVEMMRKGMSPTDAALEACKRVAANYNNDKAKLKKFGITFYALNKNGEHGAANLWGYSVNARGERRQGQYAVHDGKENKLHNVAYLYESPDK
ncbi:MAG TPA: N(4)-(beta-N-acetylglucosaminyl)-L-asparaginase [Blastocatellia bacterium]|nr:N(4)-(beta-N-acetylglucosaminyl)-L-asparaginase [Blastocatellia bacterium]